MATAEKIYVGIDGERVELTGADLTAFKAQRTKDQPKQKQYKTRLMQKQQPEPAHWQNLQPLGYQLRRSPRYE
jgi:hypothetical protein